MLKFTDIQAKEKDLESREITQEEGERLVREIFDDWDWHINLFAKYAHKIRGCLILREVFLDLATYPAERRESILMAMQCYELGIEPAWSHTDQIKFMRKRLTNHTVKEEIDYNAFNMIKQIITAEESEILKVIRDTGKMPTEMPAIDEKTFTADAFEEMDEDMPF